MASPKKRGTPRGGVAKAQRRASAPRSRQPKQAKEAAPGDDDGVQLVTSEPVFVEPAKFDPVLKALTYHAVDYENTRYAVGDHVALYAGPGKEWVCIIENLYAAPGSNKPSFKGRWYWSVADVEEHRRGRGEAIRASKNPKFELISSDNRDSNLVEVITRKCTILSWKNFRAVYKRNRAACEGLYFCDRMYYHKAFRFQELTYMTFPGDTIPPALRVNLEENECDTLSDQDGDDPTLRAPGDDDLTAADAYNSPRTAPATPAALVTNTASSDPDTSTRVTPHMTRYYIF